MLFVRDRMMTPPKTITQETLFNTALQIMRSGTIRRLPVVDPQGRLLGIVTERDLLRVADHYFQAAIPVDEFMVRQVVTTTPEMPLVDAASLMVANKVGGLPVLDPARRVIGLITVTDIFSTLVELLRAADALEARALGAAKTRLE
ncbi:MAG TPA: CBS domain-containing protein [Herpetosiphonaceae bacterium]